MNPLSKEAIAELSIAEDAVRNIRYRFHERVEYIMSQLEIILKGNVEWWDFSNETRNTDGYITSTMIKEFAFRVNGSFGFDAPAVLLKDGTEWSFDQGEIPTSFLFEDFEEEVKEGVIKLHAK